MPPTRNAEPRSGALKKVASVSRRTPLTPTVESQRQPFRVLQTSHDPAQLSLFLRPASGR